jgi:hypothetical protein
MIEGSLPLTKRIQVLRDFQKAEGANILLMTLGTGAVGQVSFYSCISSSCLTAHWQFTD